MAIKKPTLERLVDKGFIKAIIGLPANLFYGTGIPACIILFDKNANQESPFYSSMQVKDSSKMETRTDCENRMFTKL